MTWIALGFQIICIVSFVKPRLCATKFAISCISKGRKGELFVDYTYSASYKIPSGEGNDDLWRRTVADNRLTTGKGETFLILAGM